MTTHNHPPDETFVQDSLDKTFAEAVRGTLGSTLPIGRPAPVERSLEGLRARMTAVDGAEMNVAKAGSAAGLQANTPVLSMASPSPTDLPPTTSGRFRFRLGMWTSIAGAAAMFLFALTNWPDLKQRLPSMMSPAPMREYATMAGQRKKIYLPDNTLVELNVASRLRVPETFGKNDRRIFLDGEARFTVIANPKRPFIVFAGGATIRDLATVFNVRAYPGAAATQVAVTEGRVDVKAHAVAPHNQAIVSANQVATISSDGYTHVVPITDVSDYVGWTAGILRFKDVPLGVVLTELSRWYDVQFRLDDERLAGIRVTMTARGTEFTSANIQEFAESIDARVTQVGRVFVLTRAEH